MVDLHLDDVDFGDQDNWDEDILAVADDVIKGAAFERKTTDAPQAIHAPNKPGLLNRQPKSQPIDLGLDRLEMELDLEGGSLDGTLSQQLQQLEQTEQKMINSKVQSSQMSGHLSSCLVVHSNKRTNTRKLKMNRFRT